MVFQDSPTIGVHLTRVYVQVFVQTVRTTAICSGFCDWKAEDYADSTYDKMPSILRRQVSITKTKAFASYYKLFILKKSRMLFEICQY